MAPFREILAVAALSTKAPAIPGSMSSARYGNAPSYQKRPGGGTSLTPSYGNYSGRSTRNTTPVLFEGSERGMNNSPAGTYNRVYKPPGPSYMNNNGGRPHTYGSGPSRPTDFGPNGSNFYSQPQDSGYYRPPGTFNAPKSPVHSPTYGPPRSPVHIPHSPNRITSPTYGPPRSPVHIPHSPNRIASPTYGPPRSPIHIPHSPNRIPSPSYAAPRSPQSPSGNHYTPPYYNQPASPMNRPAPDYAPRPDAYAYRDGPPPEIDTACPPSPRDIARAFEQAAKENERTAISGRYRQSSQSPKYPLSPTRATGGFAAPGYGQQPSRGGGSGYSQNLTSPPRSPTSPEIINPLEEFTNMANKMTADGQPSFDYRAGLRKTDVRGESNQMSFDFRGQSNGRSGSVPPRITTEPPRDEPVRVALTPDLIIEGICEDL